MGRVFKFRMIASYKLHGKMFCWSSNGGFNPPTNSILNMPLMHNVLVSGCMQTERHVCISPLDNLQVQMWRGFGVFHCYTVLHLKSRLY